MSWLVLRTNRYLLGLGKYVYVTDVDALATFGFAAFFAGPARDVGDVRLPARARTAGSAGTSPSSTLRSMRSGSGRG